MNVRFGLIKSGVETLWEQPPSRCGLGAASACLVLGWPWPPEVLLHPRSWGLWPRALPVSSVKEKQLCLLAFLGDQAPWEAILAIKPRRRSGISISGGAVDAANSHSSQALFPRGYQWGPN